MSETRYVQHISGQGEKWKVVSDQFYYCEKTCWQVENNDQGPAYLPKSEYRLCEPPEQWVDVTGQVLWSDPDNPHVKDGGKIEIVENGKLLLLGMPTKGYRLRKVSVAIEGEPGFLTQKRDAFIVERKEPS